jgi:hypothetical protein
MTLSTVSAVSPICFGYADSSTLSASNASNRRHARRAAMQLNLDLEVFDQDDVPQRASAAWEQIEQAARIAATEALARLIARMLQDQPPTEAIDE